MNKRGLYGVFALMFLLLPLLLFSCKKTDEKTVTVELKEKIRTQIGNNLNNKQSIRIAVAAVISPKETAVYYDEMMKYVSRKLERPIRR
jgi:phosphonate transport system substrate-binding protein